LLQESQVKQKSVSK